MNAFRGFMIVFAIALSPILNVANASLVSIGMAVDGGLSPDEGPGETFGFTSGPITNGYEFAEIPSKGMYNILEWEFGADHFNVYSEMSGGSNVLDIAWVDARWAFSVEGGPVFYSMDSTSNLVNTRFLEYEPGSNFHNCLSPGCEADWLFAGSSSGMLLPGNTYVLEFSPGVYGTSSFRLEVPEPTTIGLVGLGSLLAAFYFRRRKALV